MSLHEYSIKELSELLNRKEMSAHELVEKSFHRIAEVDKDVQAFLTLDEENAYARAKELDNGTKNDHPLFAIPNGIKDNIVTKGVKTTCASQMLHNFNDPLYDATVINKLSNAKSIMTGKLNMDEFAMGSSTENSSYHLTRNPWNLNHVPGGSSGGSAAAVAAGEVVFSLGSDTGGSIRQPAAFCGIVGLKPTYGLVSRHGLVAFASSLDQIGPMTQTVADNAHVLEVIAGYDENDAMSKKMDAQKYTDALIGDVKGLKVAVPKEFLSEGVSTEVKASVQQALKVYESLGAEIEEVSLPHVTYADAVYYLIASAEASANLARFDGVRYGVRNQSTDDMIEMYKLSRSEGFGEEVKRRIMIGTFALSAEFHDDYFEKAQKVRTLIKNDFERVFEKYDVIIGPTTPTPAFEIGEKTDDLLTLYMRDMLTVPVNLAGLPGISIPCGFSEHGLPIGMQIIGKHFDERTVYRVAHAFEQATEYHKKHPAIGGAAK
ncbi:Asp-tRNA(Asn)/Glu-tRNA(Gln) amidotransferase subunit GatA [Virgibacillus sp. W0181]|uniref:Asp-tRNA(Asn)/Glu-tRNA(Gln) amidotransferase subunit GatA n=1 Tax=Virgibacillus sp. W0181 TaxID=3391581 RepID=UPI003F45A301